MHVLPANRVVLVTALLGGFALTATLAGCKAGAAKNAGFVDASVIKKDPRLPFHGYWEKPGLDAARYDKIYVAPVDTDYMLKMTDWQKGERKDQIIQDTRKLGDYARNSIQKAFREDKNRRFQIVDAPTTQPNTLVIEMALTEVVPSKVMLNALGYAPFFIGLGIKAVRAVAHDYSSVAIEARFRDGASGETIVMIADRESEQVAPVSVRGLSWYSHAEFAINSWARQFAQLASRKPDETIKDTDPFTLQPW